MIISIFTVSTSTANNIILVLSLKKESFSSFFKLRAKLIWTNIEEKGGGWRCKNEKSEDILRKRESE